MLLERLPREEREFRLNNRQSAAHELLSVLGFFECPAIRRSGQVLDELARAGGLQDRPALAFAPLIERDHPQPIAKALLLIVLEFRELLDKRHKNILNQIGGVLLPEAHPPAPVIRQGRIQARKARPRLLVSRSAQALEQCERRRVWHADPTDRLAAMLAPASNGHAFPCYGGRRRRGKRRTRNGPQWPIGLACIARL